MIRLDSLSVFVTFIYAVFSSHTLFGNKHFDNNEDKFPFLKIAKCHEYLTQ